MKRKQDASFCSIIDLGFKIKFDPVLHSFSYEQHSICTVGTAAPRFTRMTKASMAWFFLVVTFLWHLPDVRSTSAREEFILAARREADKDNTLVVAVSNRGDCRSMMLDNFVTSLQRAKISNYIVVAVDQQAANYMRCKGYTFFFHPRLFDFDPNTTEFNGALSFSADPNTPYQRLMMSRLSLVQSLLEVGIHVFYSDTDVVWLRDPMTFFHNLRQDQTVPKSEKLAGADGLTADALFMWDGPPRQGHGGGGPIPKSSQGLGKMGIQSNAGFFLMKANERSVRWWKDMMNRNQKWKSRDKWTDQNSIMLSLDDRLNHARLNYRLLPYRQIVNGWILKNDFKDNARCRAAVRTTWIVVHMNFQRGAPRKILQLRRCGLWFCEDCVRCTQRHFTARIGCQECAEQIT